ncbi:F-box protein [Vitis vinifera]|uniref:F-box protein n=1 Tax=Vitis vinifera TaxID=29760 RepID=A0A438GPX4_VITVI|nr:F-box protein [Vitis vinifera]
MVEDDDSIPDHKHCGFLSAVLAINPPQTLDSGTRCHIFGDGSEVGFRSENDVILSPVDSKAKTSTGDSGECSRRKRKRGIGLVHGSISVVRQIHALVVHKCVKIVARVVRVCGEARAVVLVDVYLPIELWSGWQFPRSASTAGALFRHLSFLTRKPLRDGDFRVDILAMFASRKIWGKHITSTLASLKCPSQSKDCKVSLPSNIEELARGANGGKISKKTCFVEETVLVKRRGLTLLKSTLSSLPIYFMSLFVISSKVSLRVEKIQMDFLGVGGRRESSKAGLILEVWGGREGIHERIGFRVGDGKRVRFWKDRWCGEEPLVVTFPELLSIATIKEAWVDQLWE